MKKIAVLFSMHSDVFDLFGLCPFPLDQQF